jgi:hypothetical protein
MRTTAHGGNELVVGAQVFLLPTTDANCAAASVNAVATATTDNEGTFTFSVPAGTYLLTSGEVPQCQTVRVDPNTATAVALTYP